MKLTTYLGPLLPLPPRIRTVTLLRRQRFGRRVRHSILTLLAASLGLAVNVSPASPPTKRIVPEFEMPNTGEAEDRQPPLQIRIEPTTTSEISELLKSALNGDRTSQFNLASRYFQGAGVPQDYKEAATWYERAAARGHARAQLRIGFLYEHGLGVSQDYRRAFEYYQAAADQGQATAANNLASLYFFGQGVKKNYGEALRWYQFAAQRGDAMAQVNLAYFYFVGKYVPKNYSEAARWFRAAAEQGQPVAENGLAFLYFHGQGLDQNAEEAAKWMRRAAEQGYAQAQANLGYLYERGQGVPLDYVSAHMWYSLGSTGDPLASVRLKDLSHIMTPRQLIEAKDRASTWLSSHRNSQADQREMVFALK